MKIERMMVVAALALAASTGGGAAQGQGPAMFRADPAHTGRYPSVGPATGARIAWRAETGGTVRSTPAVRAGAVYVGSGDGHLYALDRGTGEVKWRYAMGSPVTASPAVAGGLVVGGARDGSVHAVDVETGRASWSLPAVDERPLPWGREGWDYFTSSPVVIGDRVVVATQDGRVRAVELATGAVEWSYDAAARIRATPAVADGIVVVGDDGGVVHALDLADGTRLWRHETDGAAHESAKWGFDRSALQASPALAHGRVYLGSRDGGMYALDLRTGSRVWRVDYGSPWVVSSVAVGEDLVYTGSSDGRFVQAVDAATGREAWTREVGARVFASPALAGATLYVTDHAGRVHALDAATGRVRWSIRLTDQIQSSPVPVGDTLYVGADDGAVYALAAAPAPARLAVFWDSTLAELAVTPGSERLRDYLVEHGYQALDAAGLGAWLDDRAADRAPSVVVFALDHVPPSAGPSGDDGPDRLRRYLDAGGKVVWTGFPPWSLDRDADGRPTAIDHTTHRRVLGVDLSGGLTGDYGATPTPRGVEWGLEGIFLSAHAMAEGPGIEVLARDELGRAAAAVRSYGGAPGTGFVALFGRGAPWDLLPVIRSVAELGVVRLAPDR